MSREELKDLIAKGLADHCSKDEDGLFYSEVYVDYHDELDESTIRTILSSEDPQQAFYEAIDSGYDTAVMEEEDAAIGYLLEEPVLAQAYEEDEEQFRDVLSDLFYVKQPYDHYLSEKVDLNILLDTGDCNYDFIHNSFAHGYYGDREEGVDETSSLLWLCRQQGVSKEELEYALRTDQCYSKEIEDVMERHGKTIYALKALGYRPEKPNEPCHQAGEYRELIQAEQRVQALERKIRKCRDNLAECDLSYDAFCSKWLSIRNRAQQGATPPEEEHWSRRRREIQDRETERLTSLTGELTAAREQLSLCMEKPAIQMTAALRDRLQEINAEYIPLRQSPEYKKGRFLESVIRESANVTSHMNALTALVKMPLSDAIKLTEVIRAEAPLNDSYYPDQRTGKSTITLGKDSHLGLYCPWQGAGSLFEIQLTKPLVIPIHLIFNANVDGSLGYGIQSIYGGLDYEESLHEISIDPDLTKPPLNQLIQNARESADQLPGSHEEMKEHCLKEALEENSLIQIPLDLGREVVRQMGNGMLTEQTAGQFRGYALQDHPEWAGMLTYDMASVLYHDYCRRLDMNMAPPHREQEHRFEEGH